MNTAPEADRPAEAVGEAFPQTALRETWCAIYRTSLWVISFNSSDAEFLVPL